MLPGALERAVLAPSEKHTSALAHAALVVIGACGTRRNGDRSPRSSSSRPGFLRTRLRLKIGERSVETSAGPWLFSDAARRYASLSFFLSATVSCFGCIPRRSL